MTQILVTTSRGLDELLDAEVKALIPEAETKLSVGCVAFDGTLENAYTLLLWSRLANRVLWECTSGTVKTADDIYTLSNNIDWPAHFSSSSTFIVNFNGTNNVINHTQFGAQTVKDGIVDCFTDLEDTRPSVDKLSPDISIYARCRRDNVSIGIDLSGQSLHRRHYREEQGEAPLKEHVASAMLVRSGWAEDSTKPLVDPMCGSGTIVIEAALIAANIAPGLSRKSWGFDYWHGHLPTQWAIQKENAKSVQRKPEAIIMASDNENDLVTIAKNNANAAGVYDYITFSTANALKLEAPKLDGKEQSGYMVSNPPYGERLGEISNLVPLFQEWGVQLKKAWPQWRVSLLTSNRDLLRALKLRAKKDYAVMNGKLECRLVNYSLTGANLEILFENTEHPFSNRVKKNLKRLKSWIKKQDTKCYRIYDADLPEYNVAVDRYDDYYVVQEYAPPKTIDPHKAKRRLQDVMLHLPGAVNTSSKNIVLKVREQKKGSAQYEKLSQTNKRIEINENGARLWVNLWDYLDTGLFLDHRDTRTLVRTQSKGKDVLNLFAYTGSVSVAAALGNARSVTTVDMSNTYLEWAKDNFDLNNLRGPHRFVKADCTNWLDTHQGKYDIIFIDPPSFSNSKKMDSTWDVQRDHINLLTQANTCLKDKGMIIFSNNKRGFKLDHAALEEIGLVAQDISQSTIPEDFKRHSNIHKCWTIRRAN